ncbi:MAG: D-alanine--D-alanine ligase [Dehalococcoidia bacterium]|nr:D-alanine--D-alanine ligase [Dehalococcoidia bacterium]
MHIVLLYNEPGPSRYNALGEGVAVASVRVAVDAIKSALELRGHTVDLLSLRPPMSGAIAAFKGVQADVVFNLFEGFAGKPETEWQIALALETAGLAFTGAHASTLALCLDKARAKQTLASLGIPTPPYQLLTSGDLAQFSLDFPVIVKPLHEDGSHGLNSQSVVYDLGSLAAQVSWVESRYGTPVLVERFLPGKEFSASILGGQSPRVLPPTEIVYGGNMPGPRILTYAAKWVPEDPTYQATVPVCPAPVRQTVGARIKELALAAHSAVGAPPYARVDFRTDERGRLYVIEVNPNPDLSPNTGMSIQAEAAGMKHAELIETILGLSLEEKRLDRHWTASHAN